MSYNPSDYSCSLREAETVYVEELTGLAREFGVKVRPWSDLSNDEREEFAAKCVVNASPSPDAYAEWELRTGDIGTIRDDVPGVFEAEGDRTSVDARR